MLANFSVGRAQSAPEPPSAGAKAGGAGCRLQIIGMTNSYGQNVVVKSIDLDVPPGRLLTLLGPSGCGKTTILQSVAGFVTPDAGDVRIDNQSILKVPPEKRETAMLFQHYALFPHMTVAENVAFGLKMRRRPRSVVREGVLEALRVTQVEALATRYPSQLSGGQRQRVALARAIVTRPKVLLLDEPFGALDQNLREAMQVELRKLQQGLGLTSIIVTHDQKEAVLLSDLIAVMNAGRIEQIGVPVDIYDRPATRFVAAFTGVENILPASVVRRGPGLVDVAIAGVVISAPAPATAVVDPVVGLAVRAEAIGIAIADGRTKAGIAGRVTFVRVLGAVVRYEVEVTDALVVTVSAPRRDEEPLEPGSEVLLSISPSRCALVGVSNPCDATR